MLTTKWFALPSWLFLRCCLPMMRADHPWKKREKFFTLVDWHAHRTQFTKQFDMVMWFAIPNLCFFIWLTIARL